MRKTISRFEEEVNRAKMLVTTEEEPSRPAKAQEQEQKQNQGGLQKATLSGGQPCRRRSELL